MGDDVRLAPRQIWAQPTTSSTKTYHPGCTPFVLPSEGMLQMKMWFYAMSLPGKNLVACAVGSRKLANMTACDLF